MHSRIFEISSEEIEVDEYRIFDHEDADELLIGVDYVMDSKKDRIEDINWLFDHLLQYDGVRVEEDFFVLDETFKKSYFTGRFEELKRRANDLTIEQFIDEDWMDMETYYISKAIENEFGIRVYSEYWGHVSLDFFLRRAKVDHKYYIGGIGDYSH